MLLDNPDLKAQIDPQDYLDLLLNLPSRLKNTRKLLRANSSLLINTFSEVICLASAPISRIFNVLIDTLPQETKNKFNTMTFDLLDGSKLEPQTLLVVCSILFEQDPKFLSFLVELDGTQLLIITESSDFAQFESAANLNFLRLEVDDDCLRDFQLEPIAAGCGLFYELMEILDLFSLPSNQWEDFLQFTQTTIDRLNFSVATVNNPAKRLAGQLFNRTIVVSSSPRLASLAEFWKWQINRVAKTFAFTEIIQSHDSAPWNGICYPETSALGFMYIFLKEGKENPSPSNWIDPYHSHLLSWGIGTDELSLKGASKLESIWHLAIFSCFCSYYLSLLNQVNPAINLFSDEGLIE